MKSLLLPLLLLCAAANAQDCKLKKTTDPFTKATKISTGFKKFGLQGPSVLLSVDANATDVDLFFSIPGPAETQCFDNNSPVQLTYDGGRIKYNAKNSGSMNCEGLFHVTFRNTAATPGALNNLMQKKLQSIKFTTRSKVVTEVVLNEEEKEKLMKMIACVTTEAKTLLAK